jgi:hypothetical protein
MKNKVKWNRLLSAAMALLILAGSGTMDVKADETGVKDGDIFVVSLGDSYSSGEGIEPFYGQDRNRTGNADWIAHRSEKSWPSMLSVPGLSGTLADHRGTNWFFAAASGATTKELSDSFDKTYSRNGKSGTYTLAPQLDVFQDIPENADCYVTMTIGGNDVDFAKIITTAVLDTSSSFISSSPVLLSIKMKWVWKKFYAEGGTRENLKNAYLDVAEKAGDNAKIIIAGYPQLIDGNGGEFFSKSEAQTINENVSRFNDELMGLVDECWDEGIEIYFVPVEDAFSGHEAYSGDPYINSIIFGSQEQDLTWYCATSAYSIHPNEQGAKAYAKCVQAKIDEISAGVEDVEIEESSEGQDSLLETVKDTVSGKVQKVEQDITEQVEEKKQEISDWFLEKMEKFFTEWLPESCESCTSCTT